MKFTAQSKCLSSRESKSLLEYLPLVIDGRRAQGIRHPLVSILFGVIVATSSGCESLTECLEWMEARFNWVSKRVCFPHGLPDATTLSRSLGKLDPTNFSKVISSWWRDCFGIPTDTAASLDGKAIRALSGMNIVNHILNLFTHKSHLLLGQMGVSEKTNEIPVSPTLLSQSDIALVTVTADALLTQVKIAQAIIDGGGDYLLTVKGNKPELCSILESGFNHPDLKKQVTEFNQVRKTRTVTIKIELSGDFCLKDLNFPDLKMVGKVTRVGKRTHKGNPAFINETSYFITSRNDLTPESACQLLRGHWSVENNLHWEKDHIFHEDAHRLARGSAPEIMAHIRSLCISLINQLGYQNISKAIREFGHQPKLHYRFLAHAHII